MNSTTRRRTHPSPLGPLTLVASGDGLVAVLWPDDDPRRVPLPVESRGSDERGRPGGSAPTDPSTDRADAVLDRAVAQLDEYFAGDRTEFDLDLAPRGTPFQLAAWEVLRTIPYGTTISYGEQARTLGDPKLARAVGAANGRNPLSIVVPCHRVRGADGRLTGFAGGLDAKAWLVDHERRGST